MRHRLIAVPLAIVVVLLAAWPAAAAEFTVTTQADGAGSCPPIRAQQCTLRAAVNAANNSTDASSSISLPAGTYTLTGGQLAISKTITIVGAGAATTTISGNKQSRVFSIAAEHWLFLSGVTIADGSSAGDTATPYGGNILVGNGSLLVASGVRVTGGTASNGGGIALRGGRASIANSLIDGNTATSTTGGGILASATASTGNGTTLVIADSTVAFNTAPAGAGIAATGNPTSTTTLERVTVAYNRSTSFTGGGLYMSETMASFGVKSSIVAGNTGNVSAAAVVIGPSECGFYKPVDGGQNVEPRADCGFTTGSQNRDVGLATALTGGALPLLAGSPAIDRAVDCGSGTTDQLGTARPVGVACDSGAFEYVPPAPAEPTPQPTVSPTPTPTATPTATPVPVPVFHKTVVVGKVSGTILVRKPGSSKFELLDTARDIPLKSTVDARKGVVVLTSVPKAGGTPETAKFYDGMFTVTQTGDITTLTLSEPLAPCSSRKARAAAAKPKTRKLWGDGKGKFRTRGQYSAATVRGTKWLVQDGCRYTLTRVAQGVVTVRDEVKKKSIIVRKGKRYTARPRR
jgi:CSLREA domain-containing protein